MSPATEHLQDLRLSHGFINTLRAGYHGKLAATTFEARLRGEDTDDVTINCLKAILQEVGAWTRGLWAGEALVGRNGCSDPSPDAPIAFELLDDLRSDVLGFVAELEEALSQGTDAPPRPAHLHVLIAAVARHAYGRERYVAGLLEWCEHFGTGETAARYGQQLSACRERVRTAHKYLEAGLEAGVGAPYARLHEEALALPGVFRSQVHDMHVLVGERHGELTYEAAGIEAAEADGWRAVNLRPDAAGRWRAHGFLPADAQEWRLAGFHDAAAAAAWKVRGFDRETAARGARDGVSPGHAARKASTPTRD